MRRWRMGVASMVVLAVVSLSAAALAGGPQDPTGGEETLGKRAGLKYISESLVVGTGGTHSPPAEAAQMACGGHSSPWHPTAGGAKLSGSAQQNLIAVLRPRDLDAPFESPPNETDDDWWDTTVRSVVGRRLTGFAICSKRAMRYDVFDVPDSPSSARSASVPCDPGFRLVGGGAFIATSESFINSSYPAGRRTWRTRIHDTVGGIGGMLVHAICRSAGGISIERAVRRGIEAGAKAKATARCSDRRHVTGGGGKLSGPIGDAHLAGSFPVDGRDRDDAPDDGWRAVARNDSGADKKLKAFAICVRRG